MKKNYDFFKGAKNPYAKRLRRQVTAMVVLVLALPLPLPLTLVAGDQIKPVRLPSLQSSSKNSPQTEVQLSHYFDHQPFVSPKIIQDLITWISDREDQVVGINLVGSQGSNRYFGEIQVGTSRADGNHPYVFVQDEDKQSEFGYQYLGTTTDGVIVLFTSYWTGGSGYFENLLLLVLEKNRKINIDWEKQEVKKGPERMCLKKIGEIGLGDRWAGELSVKGNKVFIGKTTGMGAGKKWIVAGRQYDVSKDMLIDVK